MGGPAPSRWSREGLQERAQAQRDTAETIPHTCEQPGRAHCKPCGMLAFAADLERVADLWEQRAPSAPMPRRP